jgi:CheY-like chemotaxis protein
MPHIAIVEDNPDNRLLVQVLLEDAFELSLFESGAESLAVMIERVPDLVLLDISLPEMDGPEVLRHMRAHPRLEQVPVIALTAHAMTGDRDRYINMGFDGYFAKPITDEVALYQTINEVLACAAVRIGAE